MTQRKSSTGKKPRARKMTARSISQKSPRTARRALDTQLTHYQSALLKGSTPGPTARRSTYDPALNVAEIQNKRNHIRSWSYKAAGIGK